MGLATFRVDEVSVTAFAASVDEARSFKVANRYDRDSRLLAQRGANLVIDSAMAEHGRTHCKHAER